MGVLGLRKTPDLQPQPWDVTPEASDPDDHTVGPMASWNPTTKTLTPSFSGSPGVEVAAVSFDVQHQWDSINQVIVATASGNPASQPYGIIAGYTSSPTTVDADMLAIFGAQPSTARTFIACVLGDTGGGNNLVSAWTINNNSGGPNFTQGPIGMTFNLGDKVFAQVGHTSGGSGSILPIWKPAAGAYDFNASEGAISIPSGEILYPFVGIIALDASQPNPPNVTVDFTDGIANPLVAGTTAEGNGVTQPDVDALHDGNYLPEGTITQVSTLPPGARRGYKYNVVNTTPSVPAAPFGENVVNGDVIQVNKATVGSEEIKNLTRVRSDEEIQALIDATPTSIPQLTLHALGVADPDNNVFTTWEAAVSKYNELAAVFGEVQWLHNYDADNAPNKYLLDLPAGVFNLTKAVHKNIHGPDSDVANPGSAEMGYYRIPDNDDFKIVGNEVIVDDINGSRKALIDLRGLRISIDGSTSEPIVDSQDYTAGTLIEVLIGEGGTFENRIAANGGPFGNAVTIHSFGDTKCDVRRNTDGPAFHVWSGDLDLSLTNGANEAEFNIHSPVTQSFINKVYDEIAQDAQSVVVVDFSNGGGVYDKISTTASNPKTFNAVKNTSVAVDITNDDITAFMPAQSDPRTAPKIGDKITLYDDAGTWGNGNIMGVNGNGNNVDGAGSQQFTPGAGEFILDLIFVGGSTGWKSSYHS